MPGNFGNNEFPQLIERTMKVVHRIIDQTKNPMVAADVDHRYDDKYALVEFLTSTGIAATLNVLEQLDGFNEETLKQICVVVQEQKRSMTLRLAVEEDCEFIEETMRTIESPTSHQLVVDTNNNTTGGSPASSSSVYSHKIVKQVKEYHWKAGIRSSCTLFAGTDPSMGIVLESRTGTTRLVTSMNNAPFPPTTRPPIDLDLTWLTSQINGETLESSFAIDRDAAKTPRRNKQTEEALQFIDSLFRWSNECHRYFCQTIRGELLRSETETCPADWLQKIEASSVFVPVVPLFQDYDTGGDRSNTDTAERSGIVSIPAPGAGLPILPLKDSSLFLKEQSSSLTNTLLGVVGNFPDPADQGQFISGYEAKLVLLWLHLRDMTTQWRCGINYVEEMLYAQLVSAVGKEVQATDFEDFLKFHNQRLLGKAFSPKPFCYAIRQPNQYPDGELSIVARPFGFAMTNCNPIETFSRHIPGDSLVAPMSIPLNAATTVEFMGDQFLHGWMDTQFASEAPDRFFIKARARQFSCFLLVTGSISGPNEFKPKDAIILQNKDEVLIDLLATALPSAKEFRDAIKSLSPEQAHFAKSFRSMQLDCSVFGVCVVQVKPQMEALLELPPNALTKEIQLTQDLLSLFVEYQIPPNLVSYDGDAGATPVEKVAMVKQHVKGVLDVITEIKETQLREEIKKADMRQKKADMKAAARAERNDRERRKESAPRAAAFGGGPHTAPAKASAGGGMFGSSPASASLFGGSAPAPVAAFACSTPGPRPGAPAGFGATAAASSAPPTVPTRQLQGIEADSATLDLTEGFDILQDQFSGLTVGDRPGQQNDFTAIPKQLDQIFESFDKDGALRTMTVKTGDEITRTRQQNLLTKMETSIMAGDAKERETNKALDLLDALSRSGSLPIVSGELHVIIGVRHSFEQNVMATVIEENVNPIEKVDYASLLIASAVHQVDIPTLLTNSAEPPALVLKNQQFPPSMSGRIDNGEQQGQET